MRQLFVAVAFLSSALSSTYFSSGGLCAAEKDGQADLDKAIEIRITAKSATEMEEVIRLTRSAIKKGLEPTEQKFARQLLAGVLFERGKMFAEGVLEAVRPDPRLPEIRAAALDDLTEALE